MCNDTLIKIFQNLLYLNLNPLGFFSERRCPGSYKKYSQNIHHMEDSNSQIMCRSLIQMLFADSNLKHFGIIFHANRVLKYGRLAKYIDGYRQFEQSH